MDLSYKAHLIRATYEYCVGRGIRPLVVYLPMDEKDPLRGHADETGMVQLWLSATSIRNLKIDEEEMTFTTRFDGTITPVRMAIGQVVAIQGAGTACGLQFNPVQERVKSVEESAEQPDEAAPAKSKAAKKRVRKPKLRLL